MMSSTSPVETHGFQAEVKQLLHLVIHSLYSHREIFLRELISNASDANDRLRFAALEEPQLLEGNPELQIEVVIDADAGTLAVSDNGIGMSRAEIIDHLGTIARSGTGEFLRRLAGEQKKDARLIGQFGVGFYSAFTVATEVEVESRRAGLGPEEAVNWLSKGEDAYELRVGSRAQRGTTVRLKLREDAREFLEPDRVRELIRRYSDHIAFPVRLRSAGQTEDEVVNRAKALWTRPRPEIGDDEYKEFFKHVAHDASDPLAWSHNRVEGKREYTSLIYIPSAAPADLWNRERPRGLKLYVNRVFVTDEAVQFLPLYLRFVQGVVDSGDLTLNVSRELLQEDPQVAAIRSALTKRVLDLLEKLAADRPSDYETFWKQFGSVLKEGVAEDPGHRDRIAALLRFASTRTDGSAQSRSLRQYVQEAQGEQTAIYYLIADTLTSARSSPHLEVFRERGIEVLLLVDPIDEWVVQHVAQFEGKPLRDVTRGALDLRDSGTTAAPQLAKEDRHLLNRTKRALRDKVEEVRSSERLRESAACLVLAEGDIGPRLREVLRSAGHVMADPRPSLELNLTHPLVRRLSEEADETRFERLALFLFEQATLAEGRLPEDPGAFVGRLNRLLLELSGVPAEEAAADEKEPPSDSTSGAG